MATYGNLWHLMATYGNIFDIKYLILKIHSANCISDAVFPPLLSLNASMSKKKVQLATVENVCDHCNFVYFFAILHDLLFWYLNGIKSSSASLQSP